MNPAIYQVVSLCVVLLCHGNLAGPEFRISWQKHVSEVGFARTYHFQNTKKGTAPWGGPFLFAPKLS